MPPLLIAKEVSGFYKRNSGWNFDIQLQSQEHCHRQRFCVWDVSIFIKEKEPITTAQGCWVIGSASMRPAL